MHIRFSGDFTVKNPRQDVYTFLTDPDRFCPILPDFKALTKDAADHFTVTLSLGISHIRGDARIKMVLAEATPPTRAAYTGRGDVIGANVTCRTFGVSCGRTAGAIGEKESDEIDRRIASRPDEQ